MFFNLGHQYDDYEDLFSNKALSDTENNENSKEIGETFVLIIIFVCILVQYKITKSFNRNLLLFFKQS